MGKKKGKKTEPAKSADDQAQQTSSQTQRSAPQQGQRSEQGGAQHGVAPQQSRDHPPQGRGAPQGSRGPPPSAQGAPASVGRGGPQGSRGPPPSAQGAPASVGRGGPQGYRGPPPSAQGAPASVGRGGPPGYRGPPPSAQGAPASVGRGGPQEYRGPPPAAWGAPASVGRGGPQGSMAPPPSAWGAPASVGRGGPQGSMAPPPSAWGAPASVGRGGPQGSMAPPPSAWGGPASVGHGGPQGFMAPPPSAQGAPASIGSGDSQGSMSRPPSAQGAPASVGSGDSQGSMSRPPSAQGAPASVGSGDSQGSMSRPPSAQGAPASVGSGDSQGSMSRPPSAKGAPASAGRGGPQKSPQQKPQPQAATSTTGQEKAVIPKMTLSPAMAAEYVNKIPKRKNLQVCGTRGRKITVETNMFLMNIGQNFQTNITHYDVSIEPDKPKYMMRPALEAFRAKYFPSRYPAFDGKKNLYSASHLPFGKNISGTVEVFNAEKYKNDTFEITIKKAAEIDLSWIKSVKPGFNANDQMTVGMQVLDIILHHGPANQHIPVGRSLFYPPVRGAFALRDAMELWHGTFLSAVNGWKPYLNIDVAHKAFPSAKCVIDTMKELCRLNPDQRISFDDIMRNEMALVRYLKGLKVQHEIPGKPDTRRTHRILGLVKVSAKNDKFDAGDGKSYSVEQYYKQEKKYQLVFPDLPCLWVGSVNKKVHIPVELCKIVGGQVTQRKLDPAQTAAMIRHTATGTEIRKQKIKDAFAAVRLNEYPTMKQEFGLSVSGDFAKVPARVLEPPKLQYNDPRPVEPRKGTWWLGKFMSSATLEASSWTILSLDDRVRDNQLQELQEKLSSCAINLGMAIGKASTPFPRVNMRDRDARKKLSNEFMSLKQKNLKLVFVILPYNFDDAYHWVKQCSELGVSMLTQCLKSDTLRKLSESTLGNILQKVNSKLNGINHSFIANMRPKCLERPCILIGADVTHPSPDAMNIPSIAAVVASHDSKAFQYNVQIRLQPARLEIIEDLENITVLQINIFKKRTGHLPQTVIFYRDGVSEGQFPQVIHYEIGAMKRAFKKIAANYNPAITFLVVQKRHHIRLFPTDKRNSDDRNFNVQAGTIVDTEITHPSHIDFYLVSHASIQGTARPTKYRCLWNEAALSEDDIEQLTYYLCHMFARCTRSVSLPAPTYYAHLAAFRGRAYIHSQSISMQELKREQEKLFIRVTEQNPMFFV